MLNEIDICILYIARARANCQYCRNSVLCLVLKRNAVMQEFNMGVQVLFILASMFGEEHFSFMKKINMIDVHL